MALKPWYKVVTPREDLREGKPLDASEFAVHLDHVRDGRAPADYREPQRFFDRTFLTKHLTELAVGVLRRLSGNRVQTSAVYNLTTQFGGGKTHALTLLYHLANGGAAALKWKGVSHLTELAEVKAVPSAALAVFVGTEFDAITGRGGKNGEPLRRTPWGEIAFQLGGKRGFEVVAKHDEDKTAPAGEVIRQFLPKDRPAVILMDELLSFIGRNRKSGLGAQLYSFMQSLSEEARAQERVVLAVSLPSLLDEMTSDDEADYDRFEKMLGRLGKAMVMSAETETSEIIRRRLFEWGGLPDDAKATVSAYADWIVEHRAQLPSWFAVDNAREALAATYPFHPALLSVFERKWQQLPRFQQTRGILRLLALWVSNAYLAGFKGAHKDPLITMGTAPLDDPMFRSAAFEQLGGAKLEGAVTTDIAGKKEALAGRLDKEAVETIRKARLHQKVATAIFFESNGGQAKAEATLPEIRLAAGEPDLDIENVETAVEALSAACYFLHSEKRGYRFSVVPSLNKLLADRRANVQPSRIDERVRAEVEEVFEKGPAIERAWFPDSSGKIQDCAVLTLVVLGADHAVAERSTQKFIETVIREHGSSSRTFKSALVWAVPEGPDALREEARKLLAWEDIDDEKDEMRLDESQRRQLAENLKKAQRDLKEAVWRTYKNVALLGKDGSLKTTDLGLVHSSAAKSLVELILGRLEQEGDIETKVPSARFLVRNWSPAFREWTTKAVRDAFFASPLFPRLLVSDVIKDTIARGVQDGTIGYVGKKADGSYSPFLWNSSLQAQDVEISDDVFVITKDVAEAYKAGKLTPPPVPAVQTGASPPDGQPGTKTAPLPPGQKADDKKPSAKHVRRVVWSGEVPSQKWMNFYTKVLSKFTTSPGLVLTIRVEIAPPDGVVQTKVEEMKVALRELGLSDDLEGAGR